MARQLTEEDRMHRADDGYVDGFDVTVETVVGRVDLGPDGQFPPHVAAFMLVAEYDQQGTFKFPMRDGRTCVIEVAWEGEAS